jgi:hypothetical protein
MSTVKSIIEELYSCYDYLSSMYVKMEPMVRMASINRNNMFTNFNVGFKKYTTNNYYPHSKTYVVLAA